MKVMQINFIQYVHEDKQEKYKTQKQILTQSFKTIEEKAIWLSSFLAWPHRQYKKKT